MPRCTSVTFSGERHARPDRPPPSIDRWIGRLGTNATSRRPHDGVRRAPEPIRSGCGGARFGWGAARTLSRVAEGEVREDLPDDRGIVQLMAGALLGSIPVVLIYSFVVKYYVVGLTAGVVKG